VYGVSVLTQDIDVCVSFRKQNVENIYKALTGLNPVHRSNHLPLNTSRQRHPQYRNLYLQTSLGPIDFMGEILNVGGYSDLLPSSIAIELFGVTCKIIDIETLIHCKELTGRHKDKEVVLQLRAIREKLVQGKKFK
jgi:hypothetical protein